VIPSNSEKILSIICDNLVFLDSMMFLSASSSTLIQNLAEDKDNWLSNFSPLIQAFGIEKAKFVLRKGIYFYDNASNLSVLNLQRINFLTL